MDSLGLWVWFEAESSGFGQKLFVNVLQQAEGWLGLGQEGLVGT